MSVSSRDIADTPLPWPSMATARPSRSPNGPPTASGRPIRSAPRSWPAVAAAGEGRQLPKLPDNAMMRMFLNSMPINSLPTLLGEGGKKIAQFMVDRVHQAEQM